MNDAMTTLSFMLAILVFFMMSGTMTYLIIKLIYVTTTYKLKKKLRKIDLSKYEIVDCFRGVPKTLQLKNNPNEIIYL